MIDVEIKKPLYGNYVNVRDIYVNRAIREGTQLQIKTPNGTGIVDPVKWKNGEYGGKRVEKVFKRPDQPMVLYGGNVPIEDNQPKLI